MKLLAFIVLCFSQLALSNDVCTNNQAWFIQATTPTDNFNNHSSCVANWKRDVVVNLKSFCAANSDIHETPEYRCRVTEFGKTVVDWQVCYDGWKFTATESCGQYEIQVYAIARTNTTYEYLQSNTEKVKIEFWADIW